MRKVSKFAFTIAEALITVFLIGVIFVLTTNTINITYKDNYNKLYWQAFNTLYQSSKSLYNDWKYEAEKSCPSGCNNNADEQTCYLAQCWRNSQVSEECVNCQGQERQYLGGTKNMDRDFPGFLYNHNMINALIGYGEDKSFCEKLSAKINVYPAKKCESFISVANPRSISDNNETGGQNFLNAFSYAIEKDDGSWEQVNDGGISPSFIALNGQRFYISSVVSANTSVKLGEVWEKFAHPSRESYRFVVVDINGDSKPNSQFKTGSRNPDIVLFAINSTGDVIPLGLPEFSQAYINAEVYYPNDLHEDGTRLYEVKSQEPMSLWNAKFWAFGQSDDGSTNAPYRRTISQFEPLSQSSKLYATAFACKDNAKACGNKDVASDGIYADRLFVHLVLQFLYKEENSRETYLSENEDYQNRQDAVKNGCTSASAESDQLPCAIDFMH